MNNKPNEEILRTSAGAPIKDNQNSVTAGTNGPVLIQDVALLEKLAHFNRERVPERVVHAKGAGAHGHFEVTHDVTKYTKASFLSEIGKKTEMFARFSTVAGETGSSDTLRDPRGFALKFYTEEGNYDLVGNNTPIFFIRDAIKFPDFIHTQKRDPMTNLKNHTAIWDFWSLSPESLHQVTILMSDRGIPATFRNMHGYGSHTYKWINEAGESFWVKYHFRTNQGIKNLTSELAQELDGTNPDHHTEDLFRAIEEGDYPSWTLSVQIMPLEDAEKYRFNSFDVTKVWSQKDYPLIEVGQMVLDRNPDNYFAEVEQVTFTPGNIVPGIDFSPDKLLQGRLFAYGDAHRHRVGINSDLLPINRPKVDVHNYYRAGSMRLDDNGKGSVNYEPNSFNGPTETKQVDKKKLPVSGVVDSVPYDDNDHYTQAGDLYRLLPTDEKTRLIENIVGHMSSVDSEEIKKRQIEHFLRADKEYGTRVAEGLNIKL